MKSAAVYKYALPVGNIVEVEMPLYAQILLIAAQYKEFQIWALVDPDEGRKEVRKFRIAGTGHPIEPRHCQHHVGSFLTEGGTLVFHVFEIKE